MRAQVGAVRLRAVLDVERGTPRARRCPCLRQKGKTERAPGTVQALAAVAAGLQGVVQIVHDSDGPQVDRVLVLEPVLLVARDEGELVDVAVQLGQRELDAFDASREQRQLLWLFRLQIVQARSGRSRRRSRSAAFRPAGPRG